MAEILRGRHNGKQARIQQFCNDWFIVDVDGGESGAVISPVSLRLDAEEVARVMTKRDEGRTGTMFKEYALNESTGLFKSIRRRF